MVFHFARLLPVSSIGGICLGLSLIPAPGFTGELDEVLQNIDHRLTQSLTQGTKTHTSRIPELIILDNSQSIMQRCQDRQPKSNVIYCQASSKRYIAKDWLIRVEESYGAQGLAYASALSHSLVLRSSSQQGPQSTSIAELQTICYAGTILGLINDSTVPSLDKAIRSSRTYDFSSSNLTLPEERAYALLSGIGATKSDCSLAAMKQLREKKIPDLDILVQLKPTRLPGLVIDSFCRMPPKCPRQIPSNLGI